MYNFVIIQLQQTSERVEICHSQLQCNKPFKTSLAHYPHKPTPDPQEASLSTRIRHRRRIRPLPKHIRQMINRRRHEPYRRFIGRLTRRTWMAPRRHKHLRSSERLAHTAAVFIGQRGFELGQVGSFFFVDVLGEVFH